MKKPKEAPVDVSPEIVPEQSPSPLELFKALTSDEQDQILKFIISDGGIRRLTSLIQTADTPGALDIFLDRISYYHFLPVVKK